MMIIQIGENEMESDLGGVRSGGSGGFDSKSFGAMLNGS